MSEEQNQEEYQQQEQVEQNQYQQPLSDAQVEEKKVQEEYSPNPAILQQKQPEKIEIPKNQQAMYDNYEDPTTIDIQVYEAVEKGSGLTKYISYGIRGSDKLDEFDIQRRFNEFYALREVLLQRWPGIYIPPIPDKSLGGGNTQEVVADRQRQLDIFLKKMSKLKYLYYSEEFQAIFIRSKEQDISKQLSTLPKQTSSELIQKYKTIFNLQEASDPSSEVIQKMTSFQAFLKRIQVQLKQYAEQTKQIALSRKQFKESLLNNFLAVFPQYERDVQLDCVGGDSRRLIFANPAISQINEILGRIRENKVNPVDKITDLIITEQRDLEAFLQAIQTRDNMIALKVKCEQKLREEQEDLQKVMAGKSTLKGSLTKMTPEQQKEKLELQIYETNKEAENLKIIYQLVSIILTYKQIDQYKSEKLKAYRKILNDMAKQEAEGITLYQEFLNALTEFAVQVQQDQ